MAIMLVMNLLSIVITIIVIATGYKTFNIGTDNLTILSTPWQAII